MRVNQVKESSELQRSQRIAQLGCNQPSQRKQERRAGSHYAGVCSSISAKTEAFDFWVLLLPFSFWRTVLLIVETTFPSHVLSFLF